MDQDATWYGTEIGLGPDDIVLDGDPTPPSQKRGQSPLPNFRPMSIVAKLLDGSRLHLARRWASIHVTLCKMETQLPSPKNRAEPPILVSFLLWPNGWMYQDTTWYGGRPKPRRHCVRMGTQLASPKGAQPPIFGQCPLWPNGWMDYFRCHLVWR